MDGDAVTLRLRSIEAVLKLRSAAFAEIIDEMRRCEYLGKREFAKAKEDVRQMKDLNKIDEDGMNFLSFNLFYLLKF
jgi:hypothetical protein